MKSLIPNAISTRVARRVLIAQKNSPQILFGVGIVSFGATVYTACRATLQLEDTLMEIQKDLANIDELHTRRPERLSDEDARKTSTLVYVKGAYKVVKLYAPAIAFASLSVACLTKSHNIMATRNAGLSAALAATDRAFNEYRERVVAELGEDKDRELMFGSEEREIVGEDGKKKTVKHNKYNGHSPYAKMFSYDTSDQWSREPEYNLAALRCHQQYANDKLDARGHLFLNEVYDMLGLARTSAGSQVGWIKGEGDSYVSFGCFKDERMQHMMDFMRGFEDSILLDFNVDGEIWRKI